MGHADLRKTENVHQDVRMPYVFGLNVTLSRPKDDGQPVAGPDDKTPAGHSGSAPATGAKPTTGGAKP